MAEIRVLEDGGVAPAGHGVGRSYALRVGEVAAAAGVPRVRRCGQGKPDAHADRRVGRLLRGVSRCGSEERGGARKVGRGRRLQQRLRRARSQLCP
eukprot:2019917-Pleurochrysis_carterae.AAC.1